MFFRIAWRLGLIVSLAGFVSCWWMYQRGVETVDRVLARPLWEERGNILGVAKLRPGLKVDPTLVASTLSNSGYSRVSVVQADGDFALATGSILVRDSGDDVLLTFDDGVLTSVSPHPEFHLSPPRLASVGNSSERRSVVGRDTLPEHVSLAVLAMEDARFFEHPGIDWLGLSRALVVNVLSGERKQGGSTLTQQLAKNLFLSPAKSFERKAREVFLALALERRLSKDQILELYLNQIYLGQVSGVAICGIDQAARTYFGTSARRLTLGQAATLAGIISAPNRYSPIRHPERALERRNLVLDRMKAVGWIDSGAHESTRRESLGVSRGQLKRRAPWALDRTVGVVEDKLGEGTVASAGLTIHTTIDVFLQEIAERSVKSGVQELSRKHPKSKGAEVALVALDPANGNVVAMVGGTSYGRSSFNRAIDAQRQIGSVVKPFTWMFAYDSDPTLSPSFKVSDEPIERKVNGEVWAPQNYDRTFVGEVSLDESLATSRNVPAVLVSEMVGLDRLSKGLDSLGLREARALPSTALGAFESSPIDLASAFTVFPGEGKMAHARIVNEIVLPDGTSQSGEPVRKHRVSSHRSAFLAHTSLVRAIEKGTGASASRYGVSGVVGGKTGTTDGGRDAWFVGYTPTLVVAVWVGFDKGKDLDLSGAKAALPIWADFVSASGHMTPLEMPVPESVVQVPVCSESGFIAVSECESTVSGWFPEGVEPGDVCDLHGIEHAGPASIIKELRKRLSRQQPEQANRNRPRWGWFKRKRD